MKYVFSKQLFKAASGNTKSSNASNLLIRNGSVFFNNSSAFRVKLNDERPENINEFAPVVIGTQGVEELSVMGHLDSLY